MWHVPLNWVLSTNVNFDETKPQMWMSPSSSALSINVPELSNAEWYLFNKQQTGKQKNTLIYNKLMHAATERQTILEYFLYSLKSDITSLTAFVCRNQWTET